MKSTRKKLFFCQYLCIWRFYLTSWILQTKLSFFLVQNASNITSFDIKYKFSFNRLRILYEKLSEVQISQKMWTISFTFFFLKLCRRKMSSPFSFPLYLPSPALPKTCISFHPFIWKVFEVFPYFIIKKKKKKKKKEHQKLIEQK